MRKTNRILYIGLLVAQALVLHLFERMIPIPFIAPGARLGLANLINVIALYTLESKKDAFLVLFFKTNLSNNVWWELIFLYVQCSGRNIKFLCNGIC